MTSANADIVILGGDLNTEEEELCYRIIRHNAQLQDSFYRAQQQVCITSKIKQILDLVGFQVLTAVSVKMTVFWGFAPCSLVEVKQRFKGDITVMMEPVTTFEMLVHFMRLYNPISQKKL
jgi:hypothetical protein